MGLDRESDVVHIETRIAKGRECCRITPILAAPSGPLGSHLERGQRKDEAPSMVQMGPRSTAKNDMSLLTNTGLNSRLIDVFSS